MKINHLKINGFGKLKDKEINLTNNINIIHGENESGKSTLLKFISCMFYGASKNKNGRSIPDFDKYKPWKTEDYSGTIDYSLDNGEEFSVYRKFKSKNPTVYNGEKEEITKTFKEERSGIDFFTQQTGVDKETYFNTAISEQTEVVLSLGKQNNLVQRISNLVSTGDDNISYKKSMDKLIRLQNENIGTERTSQKPINIINSKIEASQNKKKELEDLKNSYKEDGLENEKLSFRLKSDEKKLKFLKAVKNFDENNRIKIAEINFNRNAAIEDNERIDELISELEQLEEKTEENKNLNKVPFIIIAIFLVIATAILEILFSNKIVGIIPAFLALLDALYIVFKSNNLKNSIAKEKLSKKSRLKFELDTLKEKKRNKEREIDKKNIKIQSEIDTEKDALINDYLKILDINFIEEGLNKSYEDVIDEIELFEKKVSDFKLEMKELEINKRNYNEKIEEISRIEEELNLAEEEKEELLSLNKSYNLAKECLEKAHEETKKNISPKFTNDLKEIISKISDGKYSVIVLNDEEGVIVELENGKFEPLERLSVGTIDQIYLSLRLSAIKEVSNETMPIILDEAFAYFDNKRLENIIKYLNENYSEHQIIIFTCSNREKDILDKLNIEYNLINLEK